MDISSAEIWEALKCDDRQPVRMLSCPCSICSLDVLGCADVTADKTKTAYDCSGKKQTVAIHTLIIWSPCLQEE
jgi:hypothetical protein